MTYRIEIEQDFPKPIAKVFGDLADHEIFGRIVGAPIERIVDAPANGPGGVNGRGSVRRIGPKRGGFEETIVGFEQDALIEYRITKGGPLTSHLGRMAFSETPRGTHLRYVITFDAKYPGVGPLVQKVLRAALASALARYAKR